MSVSDAHIVWECDTLWGMRFRFGIIVAFIMLAHMVAGAVYANEGRISMQNGPALSCEGVSVWESDRYRIFGRCQGLVYPFAERLDRYMMWAQSTRGGGPIRLGEVDRGLFDVVTDQRFTRVFISVEENTSPLQPSKTIIVAGDIQPYNFPSGINPQTAALQPTPSAYTTPGVTPGITPGTTATPASAPFTLPGFPGANPSIMNIVLIALFLGVILWIVVFMRK